MDKDKLEYHRQYNKARYRRILDSLIEEMGGQCIDCGRDSNLHFDHIIPSTKSFDISTGVVTKAIKMVREEMKKCQLLCSECHSTKTIYDKGHSPMGEHGTITMATHGKCHCEECAKVKREYHREWRKKRKMKMLESHSG